MMKYLFVLLMAASLLMGCSKPEEGTPAKVGDQQLPGEMPPQARAQAEGAMRQSQAMSQQMQQSAPPPQAANGLR